MARSLNHPTLRDRAPGQALVVIALSLAALLAVVGLVLNIGLFLVERRHLQNAADAAALAGTWSVLDQQTARTFDDATVAARVQEILQQNDVPLGTEDQLQATYVDQTGTALGTNVGSGGSFPASAAGIHVTLSGSFGTVLSAFVGQAGIPTRTDADARLAPVAFPNSLPNTIPVAAPLSAFQSAAHYDLYSLANPILDLSNVSGGGSPAPTYGPDLHWSVQLWSDGSHPSGALQIGSRVGVLGPDFASDVQTGLNDNLRRQGHSVWLLVTVPLCDPCASDHVTVVGFAQFYLAGVDISTSHLPGFFVPYTYDPSSSARQAPASGWPLWSPSVVALTG